jgi:hypothetical protein
VQQGTGARKRAGARVQTRSQLGRLAQGVEQLLAPTAALERFASRGQGLHDLFLPAPRFAHLT